MSGDTGLRETIPAALDGERLDRVVALLGDVSRSRASAALEAERVTLDGKVVTLRSHRVREGEELIVTGFERDDVGAPVPDAGVPVVLLHADKDVLVVDKPAGLVVHPGAGNRTGTLVNGLLASHPEIAGVGSTARPGIVHRLDQGTSGALVVARSQAGYDSLVAQLAARSVGRRYEGTGLGAVRDGQRCGGCSHWPFGPRPYPDGGGWIGAPGSDRIRGSGHVERPRGVPRGLPSGDGAHPPDPGSPVGHRPSSGRGRRLWWSS